MRRAVASQGPSATSDGRPAGLIRRFRRWWRPFLRLLQVRLRIPAALLIAALVVGRWDAIRNSWDKLTRARATGDAAMRPVANDLEYFCPMDPGVVSHWPGKCGVCHMDLVVRKKGEAAMLPDGVIARMQLAPYRVQLAGVLTAPARFRPLVRTCTVLGRVARDGKRVRVRAELPARRAPWAAEGTNLSVLCPDLPGTDPRPGKIEAVTRRDEGGVEVLSVAALLDGPDDAMRDGMPAELTLRVPAADLEPFRSLPADPPPLRPGEPARVYACPDHGEAIALEAGRCPIDGNLRAPRALGGEQRVRWWCPMHPDATADRPGASCAACGGMALQPRVVTFRPRGEVLAAPESAVIDTGARKVVFVESMPGAFDAVEVVLGPKCGEEYPVVRGLEAGQKLVIAGAFLLDAETRLNPGLAAAYFGARRDQAATAAAATSAVVDEAASRSTDTANPSALSALPPADRELVMRQRVCPVTRKPLGSMGAPKRVEIAGRVVFLCCAGCEAALRRAPARYLDAPQGGRATHP